MTLYERIFAEPELKAAPPVLVDVGAAGGLPAVWKRVARFAIGVGFEPDSREAGEWRNEAKGFLQHRLVPALITATPASRVAFHLTRSPQCSSVLRPNAEELERWAFADFFTVESTVELPAKTLAAALSEAGLDRVDWLKCDTQGMDGRIYASLPETWRQKLGVVEFEPGLVEAYEGEDSATDVMGMMRAEPFLLADCGVMHMALAGRATSSKSASAWRRRLGSGLPAWVNLRYVRDPARMIDGLGRREVLLHWVWADTLGLHDLAELVAAEGGARFGGDLFSTMERASRRAGGWRQWRRLPGWALGQIRTRLGA